MPELFPSDLTTLKLFPFSVKVVDIVVLGNDSHVLDFSLLCDGESDIIVCIVQEQIPTNLYLIRMEVQHVGKMWDWKTLSDLQHCALFNNCISSGIRVSNFRIFLAV
eukprot:TRINITY_DN2441_c0_g1_i3.p2 TRINITY_DN2441_c0_g1~~TRINITY_DN2441_c0_g1_i3.p2  ORF type:complete len:107 (-),score=7.04 TRINITY_DN2441_c0_g1_i3:43-363(-)